MSLKGSTYFFSNFHYYIYIFLKRRQVSQGNYVRWKTKFLFNFNRNINDLKNFFHWSLEKLHNYAHNSFHVNVHYLKFKTNEKLWNVFFFFFGSVFLKINPPEKPGQYDTLMKLIFFSSLFTSYAKTKKREHLSWKKEAWLGRLRKLCSLACVITLHTKRATVVYKRKKMFFFHGTA